MSIAHPPAAPPRGAATPVRVIVVCLLSAALLPLGTVDRASAAAVDHLVVSEVVTGGASASDELIELYNPSSAPLPLEGLELVYVTASGATVSRRASWSLGAPAMPAGCPSPRRQRARQLRADRRCALRQRHGRHRRQRGAAHPGRLHRHRCRRLGHCRQHLAGRAARGWCHRPAPAWSACPGGSAGSTVDTDSNLADFIVRAVPDPQNAGSPPVPDPTQPSPTPTAAPTPTPPTATPTRPSAHADANVVEHPPRRRRPPGADRQLRTARALADGTTVTVEGDALTASDFTDGGGYLADATGGIAVLLDGGSFARGDHLIVTGTVDDRFAQRTIRAAGVT